MTKKRGRAVEQRKPVKPRVAKETVKDLDVRRNSGAEQVRGGSGSGYTIMGSI